MDPVKIEQKLIELTNLQTTTNMGYIVNNWYTTYDKYNFINENDTLNVITCKLLNKNILTAIDLEDYAMLEIWVNLKPHDFSNDVIEE